MSDYPTDSSAIRIIKEMEVEIEKLRKLATKQSNRIKELEGYKDILDIGQEDYLVQCEERIKELEALIPPNQEGWKSLVAGAQKMERKIAELEERIKELEAERDRKILLLEEELEEAIKQDQRGYSEGLERAVLLTKRRRL